MSPPDSGEVPSERPTSWQSALRRAASLGSPSGDASSTTLADPVVSGDVASGGSTLVGAPLAPPIDAVETDDIVEIPPATFSIPPLVAPSPSPGVTMPPPPPPAAAPLPPAAPAVVTAPAPPIAEPAKSSGLFAGALSATLRRFGASSDPAPTPLADDEPSSAAPVPDETVADQADRSADVATDGESIALPEIHEMTPSEPMAVIDASLTFERVGAPVPNFSPALPAAVVAPPAPAATPAAYGAMPHTAGAQHSAPHPHRAHSAKRRGGGAVKMLFTLLVLTGLIIAAVMYGGPYLFPDEWDEATAPYADAVVEARGVEYTEPLAATAEPSAAFQRRMADELLGDWQSQLPTWRALGLANGIVDTEVLDGLIAGWQPAVYSSVDGQVYYDEATPAADLDALLTEAMAVAALDQQFGMVNHRSGFDLDDRVRLDAEVTAQARAIRAATPYSEAVDAPDATPLVFAPPELGYRLVGAATFAELLEPWPEPNPLAGLAVTAPGSMPDRAPEAAPPPVAEPGDTIDATMVRDRSFWYLVLAGYVPARTAFDASEAIVETSLAPATAAGGCAYATFAGGDLAQTEALSAALSAWVAAVPAELTATLTTLDDGTLQLRSCDPGSGFVNGSRLGVAHELIGWRAADLAAVEAVESGRVAMSTSEAIEWVRTAGVGAELAARPFETTPAETAAEARRLVQALLG